MCDYAWLGVRLVDDLLLVPEPHRLSPFVRARAAGHGLKLEEFATRPGSPLDEMLAECQLRYAFGGGGCVCDWGPAEFDAVKAVARELLETREVKRVLFAHFAVARDLETPHGKHRPSVLAATPAELESLGELRSMVLTVRRGEGEYPKAKLSVVDGAPNPVKRFS